MSHMSDGEIVQFVNNHDKVDIRIVRELGNRLEVANNFIDKIQNDVDNLTTNYLALLQDVLTALRDCDAESAEEQVKQIVATLGYDYRTAITN